jgi:NAD(P)-dependent dehydrogenase (short-subunit alcohol dehydrogenase family)
MAKSKHSHLLTTLLQDMAIEADCTQVIRTTISSFGGLDIIIANAGYTRFSTFSDLNAATTSDWDTCFAVNIKSLHYLLREALPTFNSNPEGGSMIVTSSIAAIKIGGSSLPYNVTKAAQLQWVKCMAGTQGPKIRVNAVLPGWLRTEWVSRMSFWGGRELICRV